MGLHGHQVGNAIHKAYIALRRNGQGLPQQAEQHGQVVRRERPQNIFVESELPERLAI
ncbi:hypothetical protein D3C87_2049610 [compost metagenome]